MAPKKRVLADAPPLATHREMLLHRTHSRSLGQVLGYLLPGYVAVLLAWISASAPSFRDSCADLAQMFRALPLVWNQIPSADRRDFVINLTIVVVVMAAIGLILLRNTVLGVLSATRSIRAVTMSVGRTWILGARRERRHATFSGNPLQPILVAAVVMIAFMSSIAATVVLVSGWQLPGLIVVPVVALAVIGVPRLMSEEIIQPFEFGRAVAAAFPNWQPPDIPEAHVTRCTICDRSRRERGWRNLVRPLGRLRPWAARFAQAAAGRFAWASTARRRPRQTAGFFVGLALLGLMSTAMPFTVAVNFGGTLVALFAMAEAVKGDSPTVIDGIFRTMPAKSFREFGIGLLCMWLPSRMTAIVQALRAPSLAIFHGYDANVAALFLYACLVCAIYLALVAWRSYRGRPARWTVRQVLNGSILPLASLGLGAIRAPWFFLAVLMALTCVAEFTREERERWRENSRTA